MSPIALNAVDPTPNSDADLQSIYDGTYDLFVWGWTPFVDPDPELSYFTCDQLTACFKAQQAAAPAVQLGNMIMYLGAEKAGIRLSDYAEVPFRVGELMFDDGTAVAWREWLAWRAGRVKSLLVKTIAGSSLVHSRGWQGVAAFAEAA